MIEWVRKREGEGVWCVYACGYAVCFMWVGLWMPVCLCASMHACMYDIFICICNEMDVGGVHMHERVCMYVIRSVCMWPRLMNLECEGLRASLEFNKNSSAKWKQKTPNGWWRHLGFFSKRLYVCYFVWTTDCLM